MTRADLLAYFAARASERAQRVDQALAALTDTERRLVTEAAVMGYVLGARDAGGLDGTIPPDSVVLREVVAACQALRDLYPTLGGAS